MQFYLITDELKWEIINFYLIPKTAKETANKFGISLYILNQILKEKNIQKHSIETNIKLCAEATQASNLKKYGVKSPLALKEVQDKAKQTIQDKYGVDNVAKATWAKEKAKNTCQKRYKADAPMQVEKIKQKSEKTKLEKYNDSHFVNHEKAEQTMLERYGVKSYAQTQEFLEKLHQAGLKKYDADYPICSKEIRAKAKKTNLKRYGKEFYTSSEIFKQKLKANSPARVEKSFKTKNLNKTLNCSWIEEYFYTQLLTILNKEDIYRQYKDQRYPFHCDFYIKSLDLFIELNIHWTHGNKLFKGTEEDILKLNNWKERAKNSKYYKNAIKTWTVRDTKKFKFAQENHLNYLVFYLEKDALNFDLNKLKNEKFQSYVL